MWGNCGSENSLYVTPNFKLEKFLRCERRWILKGGEGTSSNSKLLISKRPCLFLTMSATSILATPMPHIFSNMMDTNEPPCGGHNQRPYLASYCGAFAPLSYPLQNSSLHTNLMKIERWCTHAPISLMRSQYTTYPAASNRFRASIDGRNGGCQLSTLPSTYNAVNEWFVNCCKGWSWWLLHYNSWRHYYSK